MASLDLPLPERIGDFCVIGNLLTDLVIRGLRDLPSWGQEVGGNEYLAIPSGQAGLLALALAHLDCPVRVVCTVGDDREGQEIIATLADAGVDTASVETVPGRHTAVSFVLVRHDGERAFASATGALADCDEQMVSRAWVTAAARVVCFVGLNNLPAVSSDALGRLLRRARAEGRLTVLDTGWDMGGWQPETVRGIRNQLCAVDVFLPNLEEAQALTGEDSPEAAAAALASDGARTVAIKCGSAGAHARAGDNTASADAFAVEVVDTVGAGDVFNAGFLHGYLGTGDLSVGLWRGNAAAALYVSRSVDRFPSLVEVLALEERGRSAPTTRSQP